MSIRIPLPTVTRQANSQGHPFPFQIAHQTLEFLQGMLFHAIVADTAAGEYVRQPGALEKLRVKMENEGLRSGEWENGWKLLDKYQPIFETWVFQSVLISMRSHWDWYIRRMGEFVLFSRKHVPCIALTKDGGKLLEKIGFKEITRQFEILEKSCDIKFVFPTDVLNSLKEMALVRNLGLHNRWEVDAFYKDRSSSTGFGIGDIRVVNKKELMEWHRSLIKCINETAFPIAAKFVQAPGYQ